VIVHSKFACLGVLHGLGSPEGVTYAGEKLRRAAVSFGVAGRQAIDFSQNSLLRSVGIFSGIGGDSFKRWR
jgi:hypothetical protein